MGLLTRPCWAISQDLCGPTIGQGFGGPYILQGGSGKKDRTRKDNLSPGSVNESGTVSPGGCWQQERQKTGQLSEADLNILNHF